MRRKRFERFATTHVVPLLPGTVELFDGTAFLERPVDWVFRGTVMTDSRFSADNFNLTAVVIPLFVPMDTFGWTISRRIGSWWMLDAHPADLAVEVAVAIGRTATPFLNRYRTIEGVIDTLRETAEGDYRGMLGAHREFTAYGHVLLERWADAASTLDELLVQTDDERDFVVRRHERAREVRAALDVDRTAARALLSRWRDETLENLGLGLLAEDVSG